MSIQDNERRYWQNLAEVDQADKTIGTAEDEFSGVLAVEEMDGQTRRHFLGIMAANSGLLTSGIVCSGSGQNLGYKKKDFFTIGGFEPVKHKESGDDMYIVQAISKLKGAIFNYDKDSFVTTLPKNSLPSYINQRISDLLNLK